MDSNSIDTASSGENIQEEPTQATYEDSIEGVLQYFADLSLWYKEQSRTAKTSLKRDFYRKKLIKNNQKLYRALVRTPNQYNPLMKYITPADDSENDEESVIVPYCNVLDDATTEPVEAVITTSSDNEIVVVK